MEKITDRKPIKLIKRSEIANFFSMKEAIESMSEAFASLSSGESYVPPRYIISTKDEALTFLLKPAFVDKSKNSSIKILTQKNGDPIPGIPTILGIVLLINSTTGEVLSIMDGGYITALRTGAASGLATKYLSREDSKTVALFGCGEQGRTQLEAVCNIRDIQKIYLFDKSIERVELFKEEISSIVNADINHSSDLNVLKGTDIICTATNSETPLFSRSHLKKGAHINAIGSFKPKMQEIDPEVVRTSQVYLDDKESCIKESGDLLKAFEDLSSPQSNIIGEIGELVLNKIKGRSNNDEITLFKSVGTAIQDFVVADKIYNKSILENFGAEISLHE